jgi:hypothetical protein
MNECEASYNLGKRTVCIVELGSSIQNAKVALRDPSAVTVRPVTPTLSQRLRDML